MDRAQRDPALLIGLEILVAADVIDPCRLRRPSRHSQRLAVATRKLLNAHTLCLHRKTRSEYPHLSRYGTPSSLLY
jgi:hypothetical protein